MPQGLTLRWDHSYSQALPGACVAWEPARWPQAREVWFNESLAAALGSGLEQVQPDVRAAWLSGREAMPGARPVAQAYAGHQFGGFSPQLGDGRALLLGECLDPEGQRWDLALKGSGRTPFSRGGDGKAALGPMLREVIIGEAMHALGVPTTRALSVVATGEPVLRERVLPGAVLTRVAASHLRVGTFEFFAARGDHQTLSQLADYAIDRHDPELAGQPDRHLGFLQAVIGRQARLVAQWMNLGFIHGVMNTDNMTISGQTIDYGPCAFLEAHDPATVFSSIDRHGRYAFGNQPAIAQWNLARLAETLLPLIDADEDAALERARQALAGFVAQYEQALLQGQRRKLGIGGDEVSFEADDRALAADWLALLTAHRADHTRAHRALAAAAQGHLPALLQEVPDSADLQAWLERWHRRLQAQGGTPEAFAAVIRAASPAIIPRNHLVEQALTAASDHLDLQPLYRLLQAVTNPWDDSLWGTEFAQAAPPDVTASYRTFCGT